MEFYEAAPHLVVAAVVHVSRQREARGELHLFLHHLRPDVLLQVGTAQPAVPVISDVAPVHDLPEQVTQVIKWHLGLSFVRKGPWGSLW